jgi:hypothetical protein
MNNIRQQTNFDLTGSETKTVRVGSDQGETRTLTYKSIIFEKPISKFGYCTNDNEGMNYPIFIVFDDGAEKEFQIGKTGMFEFQPDEWRDVNDDDEERTLEVFATEVKIYENVPFVIDYCYSV